MRMLKYINKGGVLGSAVIIATTGAVLKTLTQGPLHNTAAEITMWVVFGVVSVVIIAIAATDAF